MNKHFIIRGTVQGVGFRYSAQQKAKEMGLTGWVKNKSDGSVELEVEGPKDKLDDYISKLKDGLTPSIHVNDIKEETAVSEKGYKDFSIK
ncbi:acylphosphatase [Virgibacillus sediminis]|uniref:Acylphosphatase n=1 Tax=Virgibacillus sediminis TaxID=202260 RepID=A0ABV7A1R0_9BACI